MPQRYTRRLLDHLKHRDYAPATVETLVEELGLASESERFASAVRALAEDGVVALDDNGRVMLPPMPGEITGSFRKNARGFGFVLPDSAYREGDLFVPPESTGDALTGDRVRAEVERGRRRGKEDVTGVIVEVISRKRSNFTGLLSKFGKQWIVTPDGKELTGKVIVPDAESKNAREGDKVVIELTKYPEDGMLAEGVITKVLGEGGLPSVETEAVIAAYNLPSSEFPRDVQDDAREATRRFEEEVADLEKNGIDPTIRRDIRDEFVCTIDPPDAKDYDDALSIKRLPGGGWELGVHIADVTHFVLAGRPMDREASQRCNSVYLPRLVIPMLPEILSNGICSLSEGVVRFCKSAFMRYDERGRIVAEGCGATAIKSNKRLTYLEAQALIDGDLKEAVKHAKTEPKYSEELISTLREMNALSRVIRDRRRSQGMIHLDLPDAELVFDELGHVVDVVPEDDAYTHTLIEMFMVEANEVLARLFEGLNVPLIRRVHPEPVPGDVNDLRTTARVAGFNIPKSPTRQELQALLDATAGTPAARAVHMAVLRTLTKAEYAPQLIGHFALASEAYAHFTSPIRRYADVTVHRTLNEYIERTANGTQRPATDGERNRLGEQIKQANRIPDQDALVEIARKCTAMEQNAEGAERDLRSFLVLQYLAEHIGGSFPGVVTGVTGGGAFIQLDKYLAEGMIKTADLPAAPGPGGGFWKIDPRSGALVNQKSGRSFNIGDKVQVTITHINLSARQMELAVTDPKSRDAGKSKKPAEDKSGSLLGVGGGGLNLDWDQLKHGKSGAERRSQKSKSRDKHKSDHRKDRKDKGKRQ